MTVSGPILRGMPRLYFALIIFAAASLPAHAQRNSHCIALAETTPGMTYVHKAAWYDEVPDFSVRISYIAHSMFFLQAATGETAATDYTGFLGLADVVPDVVNWLRWVCWKRFSPQ